jgi:hypothetical protein
MLFAGQCHWPRPGLPPSGTTSAGPTPLRDAPDTESLNAQLERAFYGQRLPAWGVHHQTAVVLLATLAENAWALQVWRDEADHQQHRPPAA